MYAYFELSKIPGKKDKEVESRSEMRNARRRILDLVGPVPKLNESPET